MIISASRRTDIPAFYSKWLVNRLAAGFVMVRNPMNHHRVSRIDLNPAVVDCIVFWTKNPEKILPYLHLLNEYRCCFQFTLTPYDRQLEPHVPEKQKLLTLFKKLSDAVGPEKIIWRYDPVILTGNLDIRYHVGAFESIAVELRTYTKRCVISFLDLYQQTAKNLSGIALQKITAENMRTIGRRFAALGDENGMQVFTCAEGLDLTGVGVSPGKCIDDTLIAGLAGRSLTIGKDKSQRKECRCVTGIDIGAYNTCPHGCFYCYANHSSKTVKENYSRHDPTSPLLYGNILPEDKVSDRNVGSCFSIQQNLFTAR